MIRLLKFVVLISAILSQTVSVAAAPIGQLYVSGPCDVTIAYCPDSVGMVALAADTPADSGIDLRRADDALYIAVDLSSRRRIALKVYADDRLSVVMVSKRSYVECAALKSEHSLSLAASSSASMTVGNLSAKTINVSLTGSGNIDINGEITASTVNLSEVGSGTISANRLAAATLTVNQRGSGKIYVEGSARKCSAVSQGTGDIFVDKLVSAEMDLKSLDSGEIYYPAGVRTTLGGNVENIKSIKPYLPQ